MALTQEQQNIKDGFTAVAADIKGHATSITNNTAAISQNTTNISNNTTSINNINTTLTAKADLVGGIIPANQLPAVAVTEFVGTVASQAAMLSAKTPANAVPQLGDWVIRSDDGKVYVVTGADATQATSWTALSYPASTAPDNYSYASYYNTAKS